MIKLYNTQTHKKEEFVPREDGHVYMYVCGPTVYNYIHIGNARTFISFDTIRRYLMWRGYEVTFVQNLTDVDDKIIRKANEEGTTAAAVAAEYSQAFIDDMHSAGVMDPDVRPRATQEIPAMIELIQAIIDNGHAYVEDGDVYFDVRSFPSYGKLSHRDIDEMESGHRDLVADGVAGVGERKHDPLDFALWKASKPGEPAWDSPWGKGRPGWHIECSAMSRKYLGLPLDIHGGGADLVFPHHENETAQSEAAYGGTFCRYWMHGGMLQINQEKMSKSLGNFLLLRDVLETTRPAVLRMLMLQTHYRSPLDFSDARLAEAQASLERVENAVKNADWLLSTAQEGEALFGAADIPGKIEKLRAGFVEAMDDDFNTAGALGCLFTFVNDVNSCFCGATASVADAPDITAARDAIVELSGVLGIQLDLEQESEGSGFPAETVDLARQLAGFTGDNPVEAAQALLDARAAARKAKDFAAADAIRDGLGALGFTVEDTPQGARVTYNG
ncbi:MAG: cysteine--tRNA ligase [Eggerthellaceae bacterium]